jgi:beta-lactamase regulating signal transducer with metallopeptidase domain
MIGEVEMLVLSLGLSVGVAALGLAGGTLVERMSDDPRLRDRVWGAALLLPLLPTVATALLLMTPAPVREAATPTLVPVAAPSTVIAAPAPVRIAPPTFDMGLAGPAILTLAGALALLRLLVLARRAGRLSALMKNRQAADEATNDLVCRVSRELLIPAPDVVISAATREPLLTGFRSARLVLPFALPGDDAVRRAVITHELAHLKRGDHRALWMEELVLAFLAFNPLVPLLRARRSAAREEACDALALSGAGNETRRAYAQSLIEALRTRAGSQIVGAVPALTFTGAERTTAMHRLKAVLTPAAPANRRARIGAAAGIAALLAVVAGGTVAVAAQREPETRRAPDRMGPVIWRAPDIAPGEVSVWMPVALTGGGANLQRGEQLRLRLLDAAGGVVAETLAMRTGDGGPVGAARMPLAREVFPGLMDGARSYQLTGEILGPDQTVRRAAEPTTLRLAPGSRGSARNLTATLDFGG